MALITLKHPEQQFALAAFTFHVFMYHTQQNCYLTDGLLATMNVVTTRIVIFISDYLTEHFSLHS